MDYFCSYCGKEFIPSKWQKIKINKDQKAKIFCSSSCRAKYQGIVRRQKIEESLQTIFICTNCNKSFEVDYKKAVYWKNTANYVINHFCSENCEQEYKNKKHKRYIEKRKKYKKEYRLLNYEKCKNKVNECLKKNACKYSIHTYGTSDFAPNQHGLAELSLAEKRKYANCLISAQPKINRNNRYSNRKGVCYIKKIDKWQAKLSKDGITYREFFNTESEAIAYRIYLENTYYTPQQLAIRDKYSKEDK